jgi:Cd2+/Zn2+-exporting ATPase
MERTRKALSELLKGAPKTAKVRRNGKIIEIELSELKLGDIAVVKAGEKIPADGKVVKGFATVNQAPITGESVPVCKEPGDQVFGGTLSEDGYLELRVKKTGDDTTISRIIRLVQDAQEEKAPAQQFIEKFAKVFIPAVLVLSVLAFIITRNVKSSLTLLVVACPCALVISTPVAVISGLGNAAKRGILIKGGIALEQMGKVNHVVFDKTGTLTLGKHGISKITAFGKTTEKQVLEIAALAEQKSEHPISKAIMETAHARGIKVVEPDSFKVHKGKGVYAKFSKRQIIVGNRALLKEYSVPLSKKIGDKAVSMEKKALTVFFIAENNIIRGMIGTSDMVRPEAKKVIAELKNLGINTYMLSGDNSTTVSVLGKKLGVTKEYSNLLPEDKVNMIKLLRKKGKVAMVGDGINDAPALATADIGIAMGGTGSDLAVEASDITLLSDDLAKIIYGIKLSKKTLSIIKQNTGFALLIVFGLILSAFVGWIGLAVGVIGHEASALIVIANSMRLKGRKEKQQSKGQSIDNCCIGSENHEADTHSCITASNDEGESRNIHLTGNKSDTCSDACKPNRLEKQNSQSSSC